MDNGSQLIVVSAQVARRKSIQNCMKQFFKCLVAVPRKSIKGGNNLKRRISSTASDVPPGQDDLFGDNVDSTDSDHSMVSSKLEKRNVSAEIEILGLKRKLKSRDQEIIELENVIATIQADRTEVHDLEQKLKVRDEEIRALENIIGMNNTLLHAKAEILDLKKKLKSRDHDISCLESTVYKSNRIINDLQNKMKKLGRFYG